MEKMEEMIEQKCEDNFFNLYYFPKSKIEIDLYKLSKRKCVVDLKDNLNFLEETLNLQNEELDELIYSF
jgi:hypothetical protein